MLSCKEGNNQDNEDVNGNANTPTHRRYSLFSSPFNGLAPPISPVSLLKKRIGVISGNNSGRDNIHGTTMNNRSNTASNLMRRHTATNNEISSLGVMAVCQRCQRFEVDLTNTSDSLSATDAELKASRQVISLLQRQLELFQVEKEGLEKLIISQADGDGFQQSDDFKEIVDTEGKLKVDDNQLDLRTSDASRQSPQDVQKRLSKLIRTQLYAKDEEIVKLKSSLKDSQNEKEQMNLQLHTLEDDLKKLKAEISLLRENLALRDQTIVSLSNEVFEQSHSGLQRRQSSAETFINHYSGSGRSEQKQLLKLNETLDAYKKTNKLLTKNVIKLTDKCNDLERMEMESKSQAQELEARCCQIQSKLLSLLKEIEQSSKSIIQEGGDSQSTEFINSEPVKLLIKRLLEDKSLDIPLSWKEGNKPRTRKRVDETCNSANKLECDELGFYIVPSENKEQLPASDESSPIRRNQRTHLKRGSSEATNLATVDETLEAEENMNIIRDDEYYRLQSVDSVKSNESTWRLYWDEFIKDFDKTNLSKSKEFKSLLRSGVPQDYRCKVWKALIDLKVGTDRRERGPDYYQSLIEPRQQASGAKQNMNPSSKQIELDLLRTLPNNRYFETIDSSGTVRLRRVLTAFASHKPRIGYCQGMNRLAAVALLVLPEEEAFWCLVSIVDKIMPSGYYNDLWLAQVDSNVVMDFVALKMPNLSDHFQEYDIELSLFAWFLTIFVDGTPPALFLRLWDCFLYEGDKIMFRVALALLKMHEEELLKLKSSVAVNSFLRSSINDAMVMDNFFKIAFETINPLPSRILRQKREANFHAMRANMKPFSNPNKSPSPSIPIAQEAARSKDEDTLNEDSSVISI